MPEAAEQLVPVGEVNAIFPGNPYKYIGIRVTDNGFLRHHDLVFSDPGNPDSRLVTIEVSTIEINKQRVNATKAGDQCAIKPLACPAVIPEVGWTVSVRKCCADAASQAEQKFNPRPR